MDIYNVSQKSNNISVKLFFEGIIFPLSFEDFSDSIFMTMGSSLSQLSTEQGWSKAKEIFKC